MAPLRDAAVFDGHVSAHEPIAKKFKPNPTIDPIVYDIYHHSSVMVYLPLLKRGLSELAK